MRLPGVIVWKREERGGLRTESVKDEYRRSGGLKGGQKGECTTKGVLCSPPQSQGQAFTSPHLLKKEL